MYDNLNCFFHSLVHQLIDAEIRMTISERASQLIDDSFAEEIDDIFSWRNHRFSGGYPSEVKALMSKFRRAIVDYCRNDFELNNSEWGTKWKAEMLQEEKKMCPTLSVGQIWERSLTTMYNKGDLTFLELYVRGAALFFEKDIIIIEREGDLRIPGSFDGKSKNPPMAMVHLDTITFLSVIRNGSSKSVTTATTSKKGAKEYSVPVDDFSLFLGESSSRRSEKCRGCGVEVLEIRIHLAKNLECKSFYDEDKLKAKSEEKRKASKQRYAQSHKDEISEKRAQKSGTVIKCNLCDETFSRTEYLSRHIETVHVKATKYTCVICEEEFSREDALSRHMKNVHQEEKKFKCPACPLTFGRKDTLDKHVKRALDNPGRHGVSFHCYKCGKDFIFTSRASYDAQCKRGKICNCQA